MPARIDRLFAVAIGTICALLAGCPKLPDGEACVTRRNALLAAFDAGTFVEVDCVTARAEGHACDDECGSAENCGNELGVGMHCTVGGGECTANGYDKAFLCILDQRPDEFPVCTKPCKYDDECGSGGFCASETPGSLAGCLPRNCATAHPGSPRPTDAGAPVDAGDDTDGGLDTDAGALTDGGTDAGIDD